MRRVVAGVLLAIAIPLAASAQRDTTAIIRGVVLDSASAPVEGVEVAVMTVGRLARTDGSGRFALGSLIAGRHRLLVRRLGWRPVDTTVTLEAGHPVELRLTMARVAQALAAVHIVSQDECPNRTLEGFQCRRRGGIGAYRDSAEIAALKPFCQADLLEGMEGLRKVPGVPCSRVVSTKGWRCVRTLIDGRPGGTGAMRLTDYIGVEFYDDYEKVPEWYKTYAFTEGQRSSRPAAPSPATVNTRGAGPGIGRNLPSPAMPGHSCAFVVYWTRFAPRFDPNLDPSLEVTRLMRARRDSAVGEILDSARSKRDSVPRKKP